MYRRFLKPGWFVGHFMVFLAVLVCLRLGLWQWHRTHEATGTIQNLGYTILWPVFGGAFIYMWIRFLQLEVLKDAEDDAELTAMAAGLDGVTDADQQGPDAIEQAPRAFEPGPPSQTDLTSADVLSAEPAPSPGDHREHAARSHPDTGQDAPTEEVTADSGPAARGPRITPSRGYTVAVSTVGDEEEDQDPELAAYNRALAALAEKDHRRAR